MATYKDDLDILKAAEKADTNKLTFNAITELDNKGLLSRYGNEGGGTGSIKWDMLAVSGDPNPMLLEGDYVTLREKIETAEQTGILDEPIYVCFLGKDIGIDIYPSSTVMFKSLSDDSIIFGVDGHEVDLAFKSDNTLIFGEK